MGREIEIKLPLSDSEYQSLFEFVNGQKFYDGVEIPSGAPERLLKSDEYYSRYQTHAERKAAGEPQVIRIRSERIVREGGAVSEGGETNERSFFCIKRKSIENGIELNREDETFVENADVVRDLLTLYGYHKFFEKNKDALSVHCQSKVLEGADFHLELEIINGLKYVEIEVTDEGAAADAVRAALEKFVALFGLDASKRDSRSWMEIIKGGID